MLRPHIKGSDLPQITDIPKLLRSDKDISRVARSMSADADLLGTAIARDVNDLPELVKKYEEAIRDFEVYVTKYISSIPRHSIRISTHNKPGRDKDTTSQDTVDKMRQMLSEINDLMFQIREARESESQKDALPYGFASFRYKCDAHLIARNALKEQPKRMTVQLAPEPDDLIWKNLSLSKNARRRRALLNNIWIVLLTVLWIVPNVLIAIFLSNLTNLGNVWPAFQKELFMNPSLWAIVQGIAAPTILSLVYFYLPPIFRRLSIRAGDFSKTARDRHVFRKLYVFFVFNNLIVFSLFSAAWAFFAAVLAATKGGKTVDEALIDGRFLEKLLQSLCNGSFFWVMWLLQRNLGAAIDLSQVWRLAWGSFARKFASQTPRQISDWTNPPAFDYASYYNYFLFYATVALSFAVLQPLVLPVAAIYFTIDSWLKKYLLL